MEQFNDKFIKYIKSGIDQTTPEGIIFTQACVNIDEFWLNEVKSQGFSKETNQEDFIKLKLKKRQHSGIHSTQEEWTCLKLPKQQMTR